MTQIKAPWTPEQIKNLNDYQESGRFHPFTCGNRENHPEDRYYLVATVRGWICPYCDYTQDWAHEPMALPLGPSPIAEAMKGYHIEHMAIAMARKEMVLELGEAGVMAISPARLEQTFSGAWNGTSDHDERCRARFRELARVAYDVVGP